MDNGNESAYPLTEDSPKFVPLPEWRPIETAPKDGVFVLITDGDVVQIGYYEDHLTAWRSDADQCRLWSDPTHWQPLPEPPKEME